MRGCRWGTDAYVDPMALVVDSCISLSIVSGRGRVRVSDGTHHSPHFKVLLVLLYSRRYNSDCCTSIYYYYTLYSYLGYAMIYYYYSCCVTIWVMLCTKTGTNMLTRRQEYRIIVS